MDRTLQFRAHNVWHKLSFHVVRGVLWASHRSTVSLAELAADRPLGPRGGQHSYFVAWLQPLLPGILVPLVHRVIYNGPTRGHAGLRASPIRIRAASATILRLNMGRLDARDCTGHPADFLSCLSTRGIVRCVRFAEAQSGFKQRALLCPRPLLKSRIDAVLLIVAPCNYIANVVHYTSQVCSP